MASKPNPELEVEINGEMYRLDTLPAYTSAVVQNEKDKLLGASQIDLDTLVDDLRRVGKFILLAYYSVVAAGPNPKFTDLQIDIQRLGYDIANLCDKSALTVAKFKKASGTVLSDLQSTYDYLLDNLEELAVETLSDISKLAGEMEKAALELHEDFKKQATKVTSTLEVTEKLQVQEAQHYKELQQQRNEFEQKKKLEKEGIDEMQIKEREAEASRRHYEALEDKAISDIGNPLKRLANGVTSLIGLGDVFDEQEGEKKATQWKGKHIEALQLESKCRQQRYEHVGKMNEFTTKIKDVEGKQGMAKVAVESLHYAIGALKEISLIMMYAAQFWKHMQDHCHSLSDSRMQKDMERVMKYPEEKRHKVWTSKGFKRKAVEFYAEWVALHGVCSVYMDHIKETQGELYEYIKANPTWDQAEKEVKPLADRFSSELKRDQKAIADRESKTKQEIADLSSTD